MTSYTCDTQGRTIRTTFDDSSYVAQAYDDYGRLVSESQQTAEGDPNPLLKQYGYDDFGRLITVTLPEVWDPVEEENVHPIYEYGYDESGNQVSIVDPLGHETRFTYDDQGRQLTRTLPIGVSTTGDPDDFVESKHYDAQGRLEYEVSFEGVVTSYGYDDTQGASGRLVQKAYFVDLVAYDEGQGDPSQIVAYSYDAFGRAVEIVQDGDGDLETTDDQRVVENLYNLLGQLLMVASPEGVIHYEYDAITGQHTRTWTASDVETTEANATTDVHYAYDVLGRLDSATQDRRNGAAITAETTDYVYDLLGNLDQVRLPNGVVSDYTYDELNRLVSLKQFNDTDLDGILDPGENLLAQYDYQLLADGRRAGVTETDDADQTTVIDWLYDDLGRLTREVYDAPGTSEDYAADYILDLVGNRLAKNLDSDPTTQQLTDYRAGTAMSSQNVEEATSYTYDANDRLLTEAKDDLTQANQDTFTIYGYGANNAGTQQTQKTVHLGDDANDPVIEDNTYTYNLQGRMASAEVEKYDSTGQTLQEHTKYSYEYADDGIRVAQTKQVDVNNDGDFTDPEDTSERTTYLYDRNNPTGYAQILEEAINETLSKSYTLGLDVIAQALANGAAHFLLYDGHGSTRMLVDATGQPLANQVFRYDAFGNRLDGNTALTSLLYSGELTDATGLQYLRARYYDPASGRFNRLDPFFGDLNDPTSLHKYLYCHGDGINGIDPTGREFSLVGMLSAGGISAIVGGIANAAYAAAKQQSATDIAWAAARGAALGFVFGAGGFAAAAVGVNAVVAGAGLGALEGGIEAWITGQDPWEGALVGGVFGGLCGWVGPAVTKRIGKALKDLVERIAAAAPTPNPTAMQSLVSEAVSGWEPRPGGVRLKKIGEYWIKEVDPNASGPGIWWGEGALKAQVDALKRLGNLAPEHMFENGRLIIRDVGKFDGPWSEFLGIKLVGHFRMGTLFSDIKPRNIGVTGQIFDPALHPLHQAAMWLLTGLGLTMTGLGAYVASAD